MTLTAPRAVTVPTIVDAMDFVTAALEPTGYRVATDSRDLNPPGLLLNPPTLTYRYQTGSFDATFTLVVTAANTVRREAYAELSAMIANIHAALAGRVITARPVDVWASDQSGLIPAYELTWTDQLRAR
jgi:hypothetical protein